MSLYKLYNLCMYVCMYACEALPRYRLLLSTSTCTIAKTVSLVPLWLFPLAADHTQVCSLLAVSVVQDRPCCVDGVWCSEGQHWASLAMVVWSMVILSSLAHQFGSISQVPSVLVRSEHPQYMSKCAPLGVNHLNSEELIFVVIVEDYIWDVLGHLFPYRCLSWVWWKESKRALLVRVKAQVPVRTGTYNDT